MTKGWEKKAVDIINFAVNGEDNIPALPGLRISSSGRNFDQERKRVKKASS